MILVLKQKHRQQQNLRLTMNESIPYLPGLSPVAGKDVCARFDGGRLSSDGGVLVLREVERRLGIGDLLAAYVTDNRDRASTTHSYADMIRTRMFAIAWAMSRSMLKRPLRTLPIIEAMRPCRTGQYQHFL